MQDQPTTWRRRLLVSLAVTSFALVGTRPAAAQELKEAEHKRLGSLIDRYIEKSGSIKDSMKIREDLVKEFEKAGRKRAGKDGDALQAALSMTADLEAITARATTYKTMRGGRPSARTIEALGVEIGYTLLLPAGYKPSEGPYPLLLIAPEVREGKPLDGNTFLQEFWLESDLRDSYVLAAVNMPEDTGTWTQLFVESPGAQRLPGGLFHLMKVFGEVTQEIHIDPTRVFAAGRGQGVAAVMQLGATFPQSFAGIAGQAGDCGLVAWQNFRNLPVLLQGGGAEATAFVEAVTQAGYANATASPEAKTDELLTWLREHPRVSNPAQVVLHPGSPIPNKAYWLEVPPTAVDEGTFVRGEIDRETNTVRVDGKGVLSVTLYFNDYLVDLDKPLKIVLNGQEQEALVPRSLEDFLELFVRGTSDSARVYVARRTFDMPE